LTCRARDRRVALASAPDRAKQAEIPNHIIAERVLGLPADIRVDKDTAFKNVPTGRETEAFALRARGQGAGST
jgi:hypothetical protein